MAAIDFPASPLIGAIYRHPFSGVSYKWSGVFWEVTNALAISDPSGKGVVAWGWCDEGGTMQEQSGIQLATKVAQGVYRFTFHPDVKNLIAGNEYTIIMGVLPDTPGNASPGENLDLKHGWVSAKTATDFTITVTRTYTRLVGNPFGSDDVDAVRVFTTQAVDRNISFVVLF